VGKSNTLMERMYMKALSSFNPFGIILGRHISEKVSTLEGLAAADSNRCLQKFQKNKYVFQVACRANKIDIARAVEEIYKEQGVRVDSVNTLCVKKKPVRRGRGGKRGHKAKYKKAIVTLKEGDAIHV